MWDLNRIFPSFASFKSPRHQDILQIEVTASTKRKIDPNDDDLASDDAWSVSKESSCTDIKAKDKTVSFSNIVMICIIPCRKTLSPILSDLWWTFEECDDFKKQASHELKTFAIDHSYSFKQCVIALYQPDIESLRNDEESQQQCYSNFNSINSSLKQSLTRSSPFGSSNFSNSHKQHHNEKNRLQNGKNKITKEDDEEEEKEKEKEEDASVYYSFSCFTQPLFDDIIIDKTTFNHKISSSRNSLERKYNISKTEMKEDDFETNSNNINDDDDDDDDGDGESKHSNDTIHNHHYNSNPIIDNHHHNNDNNHIHNNQHSNNIAHNLNNNNSNNSKRTYNSMNTTSTNSITHEFNI